MRHQLRSAPAPQPDGSSGFVLRRAWIDKQDERALICHFACHRKLFGHVYRGLHRDYFDGMPRVSGVYLLPVVPTHLLMPGATKPGDIDLLIVPYEGRELVLDQVMAVEVKVVRARFDDQGKSPNEFGFSQAVALLQLGFPFVGVLHLIRSDPSPPLHWRRMLRARVLDGDMAEVEGEVIVDTLPMVLIERAFGRLVANRPHVGIGVASAFVAHPAEPRDGFWMPRTGTAQRNEATSPQLLKNIAAIVEHHADQLFATSRFDPEPSSSP